MLGWLLATLGGRPAEAERRAETAERASYDGGLPDGSAAIDPWLALLRALVVSGAWRGCARTPSSRSRPSSPASRCGRSPALLILGISRWLDGEIDQADDLFADAAEEGLELGAPEAAVVASR